MTKTVADQVEYLAYLITQNVMTMYVFFFNILILTVTLTSLHMTQLYLIKCAQRWHAIYTQYITVTSVFYKHQCEHLNCCSDCQAFIT